MTGRGLELVDALDLRGDETVLDAGCGTGKVTERLLDRLPRGRVIALDGSQRMLDAARERLGDEQVQYVRADLGGPLPLDVEIDAVVSTSTFHWVVDHAALFPRLAAVLRPGGALVAEYGGCGNLEHVYREVRALGRRERGKRYAAPEETLGWLAAAGFVDARAELVPLPEPLPGDAYTFLRAVTLSGPDYDDAFVRAVAERMDSAAGLDYVRLRVTARRSESRGQAP